MLPPSSDLVFLQGSGQSAAPVAFGLDLLECLGCPGACRNAAELVLEPLRLAQRHGGLQLLPAGTSKLDELVECAPQAMPTANAP